MEKPKIIIDLEIKEGVLSVMTIEDDTKKLFEKLHQKKFKRIFSVANFLDKKPNFTEIVLETPQPFFLHLKKTQEDWSLDIYYKPENYKELLFFINQLEKN